MLPVSAHVQNGTNNKNYSTGLLWRIIFLKHLQWEEQTIIGIRTLFCKIMPLSYFNITYNVLLPSSKIFQWFSIFYWCIWFKNFQSSFLIGCLVISLFKWPPLLSSTGPNPIHKGNLQKANTTQACSNHPSLLHHFRDYNAPPVPRNLELNQHKLLCAAPCPGLSWGSMQRQTP